MKEKDNLKWNEYPANDEKTCKDVDEFFLNLISLSNIVPIDKKKMENIEFMYRGISNDTHKLIPTALRKKEDDPNSHEKLWSIYERKYGNIASKDRDNEWYQRSAELAVVQSFYVYAEKSGLPLPKISDPDIREVLISGMTAMLETDMLIKPKEWPPKDLLPIFALAQHYGLPTRLLDWSRSPLIATYFAASGALQRLNNPKEDPESLLCVYGTVSTIFASYEQFRNIQIQPYPFMLVQPASSENPNLKLQQGLFTVHVQNNKIDTNTKTIRDEIHEICNKLTNIEDMIRRPYIWKLSISISKVPEILMRLKELGYSANRIYDGYSGAAKAVEEEALIMKLLKEEE